MKRFFFLFLLIKSILLNGQAVNWENSISCIVASHCTSCHNPGGTAPFSLINYQNAYAFRNSIKIAVENKIMPPFPPNTEYQQYAHAKNLTNEEIQTIKSWVEQGAPEGAPIPDIDYAQNTTVFEIPNPDLVVKIPDYIVPILTTTDMYRNFVLPLNITNEKFITAMEVIPGNNAIVHHVLTFHDTTGIPITLDQADPDPGYSSNGTIGTGPFAESVSGWIPGSTADFLPAGTGIRVFPNSILVLRIHYPVGSTGELDSTSVRIKFSTSQNLREVKSSPILNVGDITNGPIQILPNTTTHYYSQRQTPANVNLSLLAVSPHAHLICKSLKAFAVTPLGDTIPIIDIPNWNFHWQNQYIFKTPLKIPKGSTLYGEGFYDNTGNNELNPNSPPETILQGESTDEEMMMFMFKYMLYQAGDENIVIDSTSHISHFDDCQAILATNEFLEDKQDVFIFPNPASEFFMFNADNILQNAELTMFDVLGKEVLRQKVLKTKEEISISHLTNGMYTVQVTSSGKVYTRKILVGRN